MTSEELLWAARRVLDTGRLDEAAIAFGDLLATDPERWEAKLGLAEIDWHQGRRDASFAAIDRLIELPAARPAALSLLGTLHSLGGDRAASVAAYRRALEAGASDHATWRGLARMMRDLRMPGTEAAYLNCLLLDPLDARALVYLAYCAIDRGKPNRAYRLMQRAVAAKPEDLTGRFVAARHLPRVYRDEAEIVEARQRFIAGIQSLPAHVRLDTRQNIQRAVVGIDTISNFFLAYQGQDDRPIQAAYGNLVTTVMGARFPGPAVLRRPRRDRLRVAFVSEFFISHTMSKLFLGWLEQLDRSAFEIVTLHLGTGRDAVTERVARASERFHHVSVGCKEAVDVLQGEAPDVIVYIDIGMGTMTLMLGGLRLAPVQCAAWGHPVTTGLPMIDYFLSSDLMEPPDAQSHYTERLVRLPNLSIYYYRPVPAPPPPRAELPVPQEGLLYLACQSVFKYLPRHDGLYAAIGKQVPDARFLFLIDKTSMATTEIFQSRLKRTFDDEGLDFERFCHFMPRLAPLEYLAVNQTADIFLDSLEWSGGNTTLEALACGLPVVTWPGRFMRGRHSYAMLRRIGAIEGIAENPADYVRRAVQLGRDPGFRAAQRALVVERSDALYRDRDAIDGLAGFLRRAVDEADPAV